MDLNSLINKLKDLFSISIDKEINLDVDISDEKEQPIQIQNQTIIPDKQPVEEFPRVYVRLGKVLSVGVQNSHR